MSGETEKHLTEAELFELKNLAAVRHIVKRSENPHPITIVLIVIGSMLMIYVFYITMIKKSIEGVWVDEKDVEHIIYHNKWRDTIIIDQAKVGLVKCNMVVMFGDNDMQTGIWLNDVIEWTNGVKWHNSFGY